MNDDAVRGLTMMPAIRARDEVVGPSSRKRTSATRPSRWPAASTTSLRSTSLRIMVAPRDLPDDLIPSPPLGPARVEGLGRSVQGERRADIDHVLPGDPLPARLRRPTAEDHRAQCRPTEEVLDDG